MARPTGSAAATGIFVASLVVIAIASILVAVGMKAYANFQKWAMWIGLAGVIVCGILLLVTSGDSFKEKFNQAAEKYYGGDVGLLDLTKYEQDEAGLFVYDDDGNWSSSRARPTPARSRPSRPSAPAPACRPPRSAAA